MNYIYVANEETTPVEVSIYDSTYSAFEQKGKVSMCRLFKNEKGLVEDDGFILHSIFNEHELTLTVHDVVISQLFSIQQQIKTMPLSKNIFSTLFNQGCKAQVTHNGQNILADFDIVLIRKLPEQEAPEQTPEITIDYIIKLNQDTSYVIEFKPDTFYKMLSRYDNRMFSY